MNARRVCGNRLRRCVKRWSPELGRPLAVTGCCLAPSGRRLPLSVSTKEVAAGREIAKRLKVEQTIHRADGVITEKNSYGNDPFPPRDS